MSNGISGMGNLSGMDANSARSYVLDMITTLKQTRNRLVKLKEDAELWLHRVSLAEENNREDLKNGAQARVEEIKTEIGQSMEEEKQLSREVEMAKEELLRLKNQPQFTVNADLLLAQLEMVTGEKDETAEGFQALEIEAAFNDLKKQIDAEDKGKS